MSPKSTRTDVKMGAEDGLDERGITVRREEGKVENEEGARR